MDGWMDGQASITTLGYLIPGTQHPQWKMIKVDYPGEASQRCGARRRLSPQKRGAEGPPERSKGHSAVMIFRRSKGRSEGYVEPRRAQCDCDLWYPERYSPEPRIGMTQYHSIQRLLRNSKHTTETSDTSVGDIRHIQRHQRHIQTHK